MSYHVARINVIVDIIKEKEKHLIYIYISSKLKDIFV